MFMVEIFASATGMINFVSIFRPDITCASSAQYIPEHTASGTRYRVLTNDAGRWPSGVDLETFIDNYDQFKIDTTGRITKIDTSDYANRRITTLDNSIGLAIGHANGANIFTRL